MRVLLITARADHGGGPQNLFQHAEVLARQIEVFIACPREEPYWDRYEKIVGAARMFEIPHRALRPASLRALMRFVRREKIEVLHSHGFGAGLYGRMVALLTPARSVHTPHGVTPATTLSARVKFAVDWLLSLVTARVIATSPSEAESIRPRCVGASRMVLILNGVKIAPRPLDPANFDQRPLRVVHVTRFVYQKNPELFIAVLEELRKASALETFRFILLGDGPDRPGIEAEISARGLAPHVEFLGAISGMTEQYAQSFGYLSTSRWEGMPIAVLEAAGVGVPVVATDVIGNRDAVADGVSGFLFDPAHPEVAARRLIELSRSRELWLAQSRGAYERAQIEFSEERMAGESLEVYRAALGLPATPPPPFRSVAARA